MNVDKTPLRAKVTDLVAAIQNSPYTIAESEAATEAMELFWDEGFEAFKAKHPDYKGYASKTKLVLDIAELARYRVTLAADLVKVTTRYLVTDTKQLESPAGFHPDDAVFIQPTIAIHTDHLGNLPYCNVPLYAHDINPPAGK